MASWDPLSYWRIDCRIQFYQFYLFIYIHLTLKVTFIATPRASVTLTVRHPSSIIHSQPRVPARNPLLCDTLVSLVKDTLRSYEVTKLAILHLSRIARIKNTLPHDFAWAVQRPGQPPCLSSRTSDLSMHRDPGMCFTAAVHRT
jgi:hypothetical protein